MPTVCPNDPAHPGIYPADRMPHVPARAQRQHRHFPAGVRVSLGAMVGMGLLLPSTLAATEVTRRGFEIPAGDAEVTLKQFAAQSGEQLLYSPDDVSGVRTRAVMGEFTPIVALEHLLKGTPLKARQDGTTKAIAITTTAAPRAAPPSTAPTESPAAPQPQKPSEEPSRHMKRKNPIAIVASWLALALAPVGHAQSTPPNDALFSSDGRDAAAGTISGNVGNAGTGRLLEGARVELPQLGLSALTDTTGRFVLNDVPAGTHEVVVSYIGLDSVRAQVTIAAGQKVVRDFDLTTGIYRLQAFTVTGEREGAAAAITAERNADNVKNVVAMDSFGNLPNLNAGEVALRLPGVVGDLDAGGNTFGFTVRGMAAGLNAVTMDGALLTGQGSLGRTTVVNNITGTMFEQVEITKGHTPDKGADSLGGTINFKSRSPLSMKEKRRINYSLSARIAPSFTQQIPLREDHRVHGIGNITYQEIFSIMGGERNLGVAVNVFSSETALGWFNTTRDYENTTNQPAYVWDYRTTDTYNHRFQNSINVKTDFRFSPSTKFTFLAMASDHSTFYYRQFATRAFTAQSVGTTGNAGILPGYTDRITQVRATPGSTIDVTATGPLHFYNRTRRLDFGGEHEFGPLQLDFNVRHTQTHINLGHGDGGVLINRITNVGWILDRTQSDLHPSFAQTEGRDITNSDNYRPAPNGLSNNDTENDQVVQELVANARYTLPVSIPVYVKGGLFRREQDVSTASRNRRWNYTGTAALPADPAIVMFDTLRTGRRIPQWNAVGIVVNGRQPANPSLWREDVYFHEQTKFTGTRAVTETVTAGYAMAQGRVGRTGLLAGVRTEKTETESWGWVRARTPSTAAQQQNDPVETARRDYADNRRELQGSYTKSFPSVHLTQNFTRNLRGRMSWSTSFGRPALSNALPNETVNEANQTLTINNPALLPQTAENWDVTLDYYFEPVGNLSVGWFHKTIDHFIVAGAIAGTIPTGANNGFNGEYAGFSLRQSANAGTATVQGWEFSYQQQFTFLPGFLKGLGAMANFSVIDTHGDFGGTSNLSTGQVAGFVPRTGNLSLSWRYHGFNVRVLTNHTSGFIATYSAASVGRNLYRFPRTVVSLGFAYQVRPALAFTCDIDNLTNEEQALYRGIPDQVQSRSIPGTTITVGITGRF